MLELKILPYPLRERSGIERINKTINFTDIDPFPEDYITIDPVSSTHGQIKTLFFTLPKDSEAKEQYNFFLVLDEIITNAPLIEKFVIVFRGYELDLDPDFKNKLYANNKVELLIIKNMISRDYSDDELSIWAQDHFYPLKFTDTNTNITTITWAIGYLDSNYLFSLRKLTSLKKEETKDTPTILDRVKIKTTGLPFKGGNILVGDGFILIGQNHYHKNYKQWFGLSPIFVKTCIQPLILENCTSKDSFLNIFPFFQNTNNFNQPIFHIDMFITLVGFNENKTTYTIVIGRPELGIKKTKSIDKAFYKTINKWLTQMQASICSCVEHLKKDFKEKLEIELEIISMPLVLTYTDIVDIKKKERKWFWATYNNCLVENMKANNSQKGQKKVWLPSYGSPSSNFEQEPMSFHLRTAISQNLHRDFINIKYGNWTELEYYDAKSKYIWESLGFEVCLFKQSYIPFASQYGALNCFTNCIERY